MGPAQPNKALSYPQKPGARAAEGPFFSGSAGGKLPRPSRAHPAVRRGPPAPALFVCSHFCHFSVHSRLRDMPRRSQTRRFPISKSQGRGPLRARFPPDPAGGKLPRPSRAHPAAGQGPPAPALFVCSHFCHFPVRSRLRDMPRCSRLHLLGVCGMINTAQALGPRKGRGGAPCRDRRGRYGT